MQKISSVFTSFKRKYLPAISAISVIISAAFLIFTDISIHQVSLPLFGGMIFIGAYLFDFKNLKEVYLADDFLMVDGQKVFLSSIKMVKKISSIRYKVMYFTEGKSKTFIFTIDALPFTTPDYIHKISKFTK